MYGQSQSERRRPSDLIQCEDATAAYILNRAVWLFGSFVERETDRYRYFTKESDTSSSGRKGSRTPKKQDRRTQAEVVEYRRALIEQTPFSMKRAKRSKKMSLADFARRGGAGTGGGRKIVQKPGGRYQVEE